MSKPLPNQPAKKSASQTPPKSSTEPDAPTDSTAELLELLLALKPALGRMAEVYKAEEACDEEDIRIYWDVRLVKASGAPFMKTSGSSTLPGLLTANNIGSAAGCVYRETDEKISKHLSSKIQELVTHSLADQLARRAAQGLPAPIDDHGVTDEMEKQIARDEAAARFEDQQQI